MEKVIIASFSYVHEAQIVKSLLEAEGIQAFIKNEHIATQNWLYTNAVGEVQLEVAAEHAEVAKKLIEKAYTLHEIQKEAEPANERTQEKTDLCPKCESDRIEYEVTGKPGIFVSWIVTGAPIYILGKRLRCQECGHDWKP